MSQFLPEMTMGRACNPVGMLRLAMRAYRLYNLSNEARERGASGRATMLRLMSDAYNSAGLAWFHRQSDTTKGFETSVRLFEQADELLDRARLLSEPSDGSTCRAGGTA